MKRNLFDWLESDFKICISGLEISNQMGLINLIQMLHSAFYYHVHTDISGWVSYQFLTQYNQMATNKHSNKDDSLNSVLFPLISSQSKSDISSLLSIPFMY